MTAGHPNLLGRMCIHAFCVLLLTTLSCTSTPEFVVEVQEEESGSSLSYDPQTQFADGSPIVTKDTQFEGRDTILVTFAGDIMAHKPNYSQGHYDEIYEDISYILKESDLALANLETPVADSLDYSTYPAFNVHHEYADAAIDAGFNVFSLANNHTNDQYLVGIQETKAYFDKKREQTAQSGRPVHAAGLKEKSGDALTYDIIEVNGWTVLFAAITEILNRNDYSSYIDFYRPTQKQREALVADIKKLREEHPCDLFILSVHNAEEEYVLPILESQRKFYYKLLGCGVDVIWSNHPHVAKGWEVITDENGNASKMIFYAMGNTISAQRTNPQFKRPETNRDYTGDGYLAQVRFEKKDSRISIELVNPILITTYITKDWLFVIRELDDEFIKELETDGRTQWAAYLEERRKLMQKIEGTTTDGNGL